MSALGEEPLGVAARCDSRAAQLLSDDPAEAERLILELRGQRPEDPWCAAALGEVWLIMGRDFHALGVLQEAMELLEPTPPQSTGVGLPRWGSKSTSEDSSARDEGGSSSDGLVGRAEVAALLCIGLSRTGQWEEAREYCRDRAGARPLLLSCLAPILDYYGGIAEFQTGNDAAAVERLGDIAGAGLSAGFEESAGRFRTLAYGRMAGVRPGLVLNAGLGAGWDSNALMAPEDPTTVGLSEDVSSSKGSIWTTLGYNTRNAGPWSLQLRGIASRSFHAEQQAEALNATDAGASASLQEINAVGSGKLSFEGKYAYRVTWLDGGPATLEPDLFAFVETHTMSGGPSFQTGGGTGLSLRYSASFQRFAEMVRNGTAHNLSVGEEFRLGDDLTGTFAQSGSYFDSSSSGAYRRYGAALGTFWAYRPAWLFTWTLTARGTIQWEDYFDSTGYFDTSRPREDWLYFTRAELSRNLGSGLSAGLYTGLTGRRSSATLLTYDKVESGLLLTWEDGGAQ